MRNNALHKSDFFEESSDDDIWTAIGNGLDSDGECVAGSLKAFRKQVQKEECIDLVISSIHQSEVTKAQHFVKCQETLGNLQVLHP